MQEHQILNFNVKLNFVVPAIFLDFVNSSYKMNHSIIPWFCFSLGFYSFSSFVPLNYGFQSWIRETVALVLRHFFCSFSPYLFASDFSSQQCLLKSHFLRPNSFCFSTQVITWYSLHLTIFFSLRPYARIRASRKGHASSFKPKKSFT